MNDFPLISVLIPIYNVDPFVYDAIDSICNQTYTNLEIIVVDDCSTDKTYEIVEQMMKNDYRIKLFRNPQNFKIAATLNYALSQATGKYIARMDGDDFSKPTKIEKQYNFLLNHPEYALVGTNYIFEDESGHEISRTHYLNNFSKIKKLIRYESPVAHIWLTTKKIYDEIGEYRMAGVEDYDFLLRIVSRGYKITNLKEHLYKVKQRNGNSNMTIGLPQRKAIDYALKLHKERCSKKNDSFSISNFNDAVTVSEDKRIKFQKSSEYFNLFLKYRKTSFFNSLHFLLLSIYKSPNAQLKYLYRRLILKIMKNI